MCVNPLKQMTVAKLNIKDFPLLLLRSEGRGHKFWKQTTVAKSKVKLLFVITLLFATLLAVYFKTGVVGDDLPIGKREPSLKITNNKLLIRCRVRKQSNACNYVLACELVRASALYHHPGLLSPKHGDNPN